MAKKSKSLIPAERIERSNLLIRGQKVMLDSDLAELYGVETGQLVRQLKRNRERFPSDFTRQFAVVFDAIRQLMQRPRQAQREMGYHTLADQRKN